MVVSAGAERMARGQCLGAAGGTCAEVPDKHEKVAATASPEKSLHNFLQSPIANVSNL